MGAGRFLPLVAFAFLAALCGVLFPLTDAAMTGAPLVPPGWPHLLGTSPLGQDNLIRALRAAPASIGIGLVAGGGTVLVALVYGYAVASAPGWAGRVMLRISDLMLALPDMVLMMLIASYARPGPAGLALILIAFSWPSDIRPVAAMVRRERARDSFYLAQSFGAGAGYLLRRHALPPMLPVLAAMAVMNSRRAVMHAAGLAFLGLANPAIPSWGSMLAEALTQLQHPGILWLVAPPALFLTGFVLVLGRIGLAAERDRSAPETTETAPC